MNYYFGFSLKGLIVFLLPMIPNIFYFLIPASSDVSRNPANSHLFLDILEHGSQAIFIFMLILVVRKQSIEMICPYTLGMAIMLFFYYVLWIFYFKGKVNLYILFGLAVFPVVYFILAELWLHNILSIIPTIIFGIVHVLITYIDFKLKYIV